MSKPSKPEAYDVAIVGAGPAGSTCAYYLARQGKRVLLLEKNRFPRDKICGDAICGRAQLHLEHMGVLQAVVASGEGQWMEVGGMVSPGGLSFVGNSAECLGKSLVIVIRRKILDARVARAAVDAGAELIEDAPIAAVQFHKQDREWSLHCRTQAEVSYRARVLIAADGANSRLARSLGIVQGPPDGVCSRAYVDAGTADFPADGVMYYPLELLPGYFVILREAGGHLNLCCYLIPGGSPKLTDLKKMHDEMIQNHPDIRTALGPRAKIERMVAAPLRLGGVAKSYSDHFLVIGDAAGHIDPLTGEGIQYALDGAEIAAQTLDEAFTQRDWSAAFLRRFHNAWMKAFGRDFRWSRTMAGFYTRHPILLDASASLMQKRGAQFLVEWGEVMTGARPKSDFFRPRIALPLAGEVARRWWKAEWAS